MESDEREPQVRNEASGPTGGDVYQSHTMTVVQNTKRLKPVRPNGIPVGTALFVNRVEKCEQLRSWITEHDDSHPLLVLVSGPRGVGTSSFAIHVGNLLADELFPDGHLHVDLKDHRDGDEDELDVSAVLGRFLTAFGLEDAEVPAEPGSRQERYRALTKGKRILVVLDHVNNAGEVRALRPDSTLSTVIATSHRRDQYLTGQQYVSLEPLDTDAAHDLLRRLITDERVETQADDAAALIELCGQLPQALCIAVSRMPHDEELSFAEVADEIRRQLERGGSRSSDQSIMDAVCSPAYRRLSPAARRLYRHLGWHPGVDVSKPAMIGVSDSCGDVGVDAVAELWDHHLLDRHRPGRYRLPPLVKAHARARAHDADGEAAEKKALAKWTDWYVKRALTADRTFIPHRNRVFQGSGANPATFATQKQAREWFEAERNNLQSVLRRCDDFDRHTEVMRLAESLWVLYLSALYLEDWRAVMRLAVDAAKATGNVAAQIRFRTFLARAYMALGLLDKADLQLEKARAVRVFDAVAAEMYASAVEFTGRLRSLQGRFHEAIAEHEHARTLFAEQVQRTDVAEAVRLANLRGEALQDHYIGKALLALGEASAAAEHLRTAERAMNAMDGHERDVGRIRTDLGRALLRMEDLPGAREVLTDAVQVLQNNGWYRNEAEALVQLATVAGRLGETELERECLESTRDRYQAVRSPNLPEVEEWLAALSG